MAARRDKGGVLGFGIFDGTIAKREHIPSARWQCQTLPDREGEEKIRCILTFGSQETMLVELKWWGVSVEKIPYTKPYPYGIRAPADLDIEVIEPQSVREDIASGKDYLDPEEAGKMEGKRRLVIKADNVAIGVETGSERP